MSFNFDKPRVLAISGHPDDAEIGCGGYLARLASELSAELHIAVMTHGSRFGSRNNMFGKDSRARESLLASLFFHSRMACELEQLPKDDVDHLLMGTGDERSLEVIPSTLMSRAECLLQDDQLFEEASSRLHFGGFDDRCMNQAGHAAIEFIENLIDQIEPDIILTHASGDLHDDHRQTHNATISAARDYRGVVIFYQAPSTIPNDFAPTFFVSLDRKALLIKTLAILAHSSQRQRGMRFVRPSYVNALAAAWSRFHRQTNGWLEAFEVNRCFWLNKHVAQAET